LTTINAETAEPAEKDAFCELRVFSVDRFVSRYLTSSSSTSNTSVACGGIAPPAPRAP
jgi:hypothetical protein